MSDQDTISTLGTEIGSAFEPLALAFRSPTGFSALMERMGWQFDSVPAALNSIRTPAESIAAIIRGGEFDSSEMPQLLAAIAALIAAANGVASQPAGSFPPGLDVAAFKNEFPRQLIDYLLAEYLSRRQPGWANLLKLIGVLRLEDVAASGSRPAFTRRTVAWEDLARFFSDPTLILRNAYRWAQADFKDEALLGNVADALDGWHIDYRFTEVDPAMFDNLTAGASNPDNVFPAALRMPLFEQNISGFGGDVGLQLLILPQTAAELPGFAILPYAHGSFQEEIPVTDELFVNVRSGADLAGGVAIIVRPSRPLDVQAGFAGGAPSSTSASIALGIVWRRPAGAEIVLIGSGSGSKLRAQSIGFEVGARVDSAGNKDLYVENAWTGAGIVIKPGEGEADSFLAKLLPADGIHADFNFTVGLSTSQGVYFSGSGGLEVNLPTHIQLGPIEIQSATLSVQPKADPEPTIPINLGVTIKGDLGVLQGVVENIGLTASFVFPDNNQGNLGPADVRLSFKPPNGVGLSLDAGLVKGGGYLYFDFDRGEYAGVLELSISEIVTVKAIGIITTKMPDGSKGFSLLIIITAEFGTGIQLGFGFTLIGLGGLLGLNRTMSLQPLMEGVRTGAINSIMFPQNPVENAPKIISDLRTIFPPYEGKFLIGPMAKLGWGTPTLVSVSLGVIIEIPGNIAILGVLKIALPAEEAALIVLQANFAGALEFDKGRLYFFAALFESRVLYLTLEGEMGLLVAWGDDANFVVSAGGFHPRFNPPPLPFPAPQRMAISILNTDIARIRTESYFAVTSNTVQFGSNTEVMFDVDVARVDGHLGFDALFQFSPFHFIIEVSASVSLKVFGVGLFSIRLHFELEGPTPWRAHGTGSISFFFFDVSADFDITWGESKDTTLPPIAVIPLLKGEFDKLDNWRAQLPPANNLLVSLRKLDATESAEVLHPLGTLRVSQRAVPLDLKIDKVGNQKPSDANQFTLTATAGLVKAGDADEQFAKAQFLNMSDADKLSQRAFDPMHGGLLLASGAQQLGSTKMGKRKVRYEEIIIDSNFKRFRRRFRGFTEAFFGHFLVGGAISKSVLSQNYKKLLDPFDDKVGVKEGGFTVAQTEDNKPYSASSTYFASEAMANQFLQSQIAANPDLHDALHVIPQYEARL